MAHVFDELALQQQLERLPRRLRAAFAAAAAERLLPAYGGQSVPGSGQDGTALARLLDRLWNDLETESMSHEDIAAAVEACMRLIPSEESQEWSEGGAAAEDAAAAVCYAYRAWQNGQAADAAWAARRVYEALDNFVINRDDIDTNKPGMETRILSDPLIQAELERQHRDLDDLLTRKQSEIAAVQRIRDRARTIAKAVFG